MKPAKKAQPVKALKAKIAERPAETAAPTVFVALTAVLVSFGLSPAQAGLISGLVAALTPAAATFAREKGWI